jgi:uncharacterized protein YciI
MSGFEKVFVVQARYCEDAVNARAPHRDAHVSRALELRAAGTVVLAGAFEDLWGSLVVYRAADEAAVREIVESDVYWREGVWVEYDVRPCNVLAP